MPVESAADALPAERGARCFRGVLHRLGDPGALAARVFAGARYAFWLDSASAGIPGGAPARWSLMGVPTRVVRQESGSTEAVIRTADGRAAVSSSATEGTAGGGPGQVGTGDSGPAPEPDGTDRRCAGPDRSVFAVLERELAQARAHGSRLGETPEGIPAEVRDLATGWVGYFGYELRHQLDAVRPPSRRRSRPTSGPAPGSRRVPAPEALPDALWMEAGDVVVLDHASGDLWAVGSPVWVRRVRDALAETTGKGRAPTRGVELPAAALPAPDRAEYEAKVRACLEAIREGESYEVCLTAESTTSLDAPLGLDRALDLYRDQRHRNPAPHAAFLWAGDAAVLSSSPERFLSVDRAGRCEAKPIKGTVPRGKDAAEDARAAAWLRSDPKTRAENLMIVDLMRNDFSRVCRPGTVRVPVLLGLESYASVHQLVSTVEGRLRPGLGAIDLLRAAFPGGSMTGAPKARTLEIIDALEARRRGVYSGALGRIGPESTDLSIVIRTLVLAADGGRTRVSVAAGGAVVADSDPAAEYEEMIAKMRAPLPRGWSVRTPEEDPC